MVKGLFVHSLLGAMLSAVRPQTPSPRPLDISPGRGCLGTRLRILMVVERTASAGLNEVRVCTVELCGLAGAFPTSIYYVT